MPDEITKSDQNIPAAADGCSIKMDLWERKRCGRPLHHTLREYDPQPVCLMHSKDPAKADDELYQNFMQEFKSVLAEAGDGEASFLKFIFPRLIRSKHAIACSCSFEAATFTQDALFSRATFRKNADFSTAEFMQDAMFSEATFTQDADFFNATFTQDSLFPGATFTQNANFRNARFTQRAFFSGAKFKQNAEFFETEFTYAYFSFATFAQNANFFAATFTQTADFSDATLMQTADFSAANFLSAATFRRTKFVPTEPDVPSAVFALASFAKPEEVVFDNLNLSHVSFHNCDVSQFRFTSSVEWGKADGRHAVIFEETATEERAKELGIWTGGKRNEEGRIIGGRRDYKAIAQIYQQLKKNYDARLDYWTANEFHFGEMEMQRLDLPTSGPLLLLRQWWHPRLSLVALYRWGSNYGNSYQRPLWCMVAMLALFTLLFPVAGLVHTVGTGPAAQVWCETFASAWHAGTSPPQKLWYLLAVLLHSFITSVDTASFQRNLDFTPAYPWGRVLAILETLLTSTLVALFFLALRRQFRR